AMKKGPKKPPLSDCLSDLFLQEEGKVISNNQKNEKPAQEKIEQKTELKNEQKTEQKSDTKNA
ncbi:MAG: hypothetical protein HUJ54_13080, partial [Erysipelotrichaceae bacterium]|nr:hypothetical protein [Erysipelotrichaceae bacterium]